MSSPPSIMPDVEPSRGEKHHSSTNNHKRHSKSRPHSKKSASSCRRSAHRRTYSANKREKSPTCGGEHSLRCSRQRYSPASSGKTPESSKSLQKKLRLASGGSVGEIRSPPLHSLSKNPSNSSHSDNNADRSGGRSNKKRSSRNSGARYISNTPTSKRNEKRAKNLRIAQPGAVAAPPILDHPSGGRVTTGSTVVSSPVTAPAAANVKQVTMGQNMSHDQHLVPLQGIAASNVDEIEAAEPRGREGGQNERNKEAPRDHQQRISPGNTMLVVTAPVPKQDKLARKYTIASSLVIFAMAAVVVVWQVIMIKGKHEPPGVGSIIPFNPPTHDDCVAVSQGVAGVRHNETTVRTFAVEINIAINSGMNMTLLKAELEAHTQRYLLPLLVGCKLDGPSIIIENNSFFITNALLEPMILGEPKACDIATPTSPECSLVYMEMDLFLKDPEVSSDYIVELIAFVFQHKGLLELLDLITPVEIIDTLAQYEVLDNSSSTSSTLLPSSSPSIKPVQIILDDLPTKTECQEIASGIGNVGGQGVLQEYDIYMDVMLDIPKNDLTAITLELQQKLQQFLMPALAGCDPSFVLDDMGVENVNSTGDLSTSNQDGSTLEDNNRRRLQTEGMIFGAQNHAEYLVQGSCFEESEPSPCYRYVIHLDIFVKSIVASADFTQPIMTKFKEEPLVERLGLLSPFVKITIVDTIAQTPSAIPSISPSASPSTPVPSQMPSMDPSTSPSVTPSAHPTHRPTHSPTHQPTGRPTQTPPPTPGPTPNPTTPWPTRPPTRNPTPWPTPPPTRWPTPSPTPPPTLRCIQSNSDLTSAVSDYNNASSPSSIPGYYYPTPLSPSVTPRDAIVAQYGPIGDWCFGPSVSSMANLFQYSNFNEDISGWDVSGITDMSSMLYAASSFNQDIGVWDVSSVTDVSNMFYAASSFNGNIGAWDVSSVNDSSNMFYAASSFNQDIGGWDVSSVIDSSYMFMDASVFNQDLSTWKLTSLSNGNRMFHNAGNFNQNLCDWGGQIPTSARLPNMFSATSCIYTYSSPSLVGYPPSYSLGPFCHYC